MIKFKNTVSEVFNYVYHCSQNVNDYVREEGVYLFECDYDDKKVEVKLETALSFYHGDYSTPSSEYEISEIMIDDQEVDIDDLDQDLQDAINDLRLETRYDSDPESYTFDLEGQAENNFGSVLSDISYSNLQEKLNEGYIVVGAKLI